MNSIDLNSASLTSSQIRDNYFDQNSLNSVKLMGKHNDPQAMKEVAKKFEAMFMQQVMKSMREANEVFSEGNPFSSNEEKFHQDMLDQQLVLNLTSGEGMGLAKALYAQLMKNYKPAQTEDAAAKVPVNAVSSQISPGLAINPATKMMQIKPVERATSAQKVPVAKEPQSFIEKIKPFAEKAAKTLNIGVEVLLAQTALETGWGKFVLHDAEGNNTYNLFNIKTNSSWSGDKVVANTLEVIDGSPVKLKSDFKQYKSYEESFDDYVNLIKTAARYEEAAGAKTPEDYLVGLQNGGYATDPNYAKKILKILSSETLQSVNHSDVGVSPKKENNASIGGNAS